MGKWYYSCENGWHCSKCGKQVKEMPTDYNRQALYDFCPWCGESMADNTDKSDTGEWIAITSYLDNDIHIICSHCKEEFIGKSTLEEWKKEYLFCHRCGTKMNGGE